MTDQDALLAGILADPDDDLPRLVYADWLDENGQPERAEFVRAQCESGKPFHMSHQHDKSCPRYGLYRTGFPDDVFGRSCPKCRPRMLRWRQAELLDDHSDAWNPIPGSILLCDASDRPDARHAATGLPVLVLARGFIDSLTCPAADWLAHADAVYWHPKQTVTCPLKSGWNTRFARPEAFHPVNCSCQGTGLAARPFVPTAHPITKVTLTTWPGETVGWPHATGDKQNEDGTRHYVAWPTVSFGPQERPQNVTPEQFAAITGQVLNRAMMERYGIR